MLPKGGMRGGGVLGGDVREENENYFTILSSSFNQKIPIKS